MNMIAVAYGILRLVFIFFLIWISVYLVIKIIEEIKK